MTKQRNVFVFCVLVFGSLLAACGGGSGDPPSPTSGCGQPPPLAHPQLWLVYPMPSATSVPNSIGSLVFASLGGLSSEDTITVSSALGTVPAGAFTPAPSPLPSPRVTPGSEFGSTVPYVALAIPTLAPATTYSVSYSYADWANNPPSCQTRVTQALGSFTTQ